MRILLVAPMFPPQRGVAPLRTHSFAATWAAAGHSVTVLTTQKRADQVGLDLPNVGFEVVELPYRGPWPLEFLRRVDKPGASTRSTNETSRATIRSLLSPFRRLKSRTGIFSSVRQPDLTDGWTRPAAQWGDENGCWDIVVSSGGPPAAHLAAMRIKLRGRARTWLADFRDLWTENHIYCGLFPITLIERQCERRVFACVDRLVTVSPGLARQLVAKAHKPVDVIYNGYDRRTFAGLSAEPAFPMDGKTRLVYTGTVYERGQDLESLCAAVAAEPNAMLVVASDREDLWRAAARRTALGNRLDYRGTVPRELALRMQRDASALILLDWYDARHGVLTGKVFEYLMSPAPIFVVGGSPNSPAASLVVEAGRGLGLGRDVARIREAIQQRQVGKLQIGQFNAKFIASLEREQQAKRLLAILEETVN